MDNLFEQLTNISKAHGYDILSQQVKELKEENEIMKNLLADIHTDDKINAILPATLRVRLKQIIIR